VARKNELIVNFLLYGNKRVAFCKSYLENLYSLLFLQISKKGKTLLTFFLADEKESKKGVI